MEKGDKSKTEMVKLLNELQVHQIELIAQNEELRLSQIDLRQSNQKWEAIISASPDGIGMASLDGKLQFFSDKLAQMFGYSVEEKDEFIGRSFFDFIDQSDHEKLSVNLHKLLAKESNHKVTEYLAVKKDKSRFYVEINSAILYDPKGNHTGFLYVVRDITDRKIAEKALHETNDYLENLINYANAPIIVWDQQFRITRFNHAFESLTGRSEAEVVGQSLEILFPAALAESSMTFIRETSTHERWESVEIEIMHQDKSVRTVLWNSATLFASDGITTVATIAQGQDITGRKRAEKEILDFNANLKQIVEERTAQLSEINKDLQKEIEGHKKTAHELKQLSDRFELAARAGGVGVWDYDIVNNILVWDDQMFALYGIKKEDFSGAYDAWQSGVHYDDRERGNAEIEAAVRGEKEFNTEFRVMWPDGTIRNIRAMANIHCDDSGKPLHMVGTNWDITAQKQSEALLEQTRHNYETFFNTIDDFLFVLDEQGNMIHVNSTVIKRLGYTNEELKKKSVLMVHPAERREEAGRIVGEMLAGTADFCPVPLITKSGGLIPVETRTSYGSWNGKPAIFGVSKDVSMIKLSEEKFSKAFHSNSSLMAISSFDGRFMDVNDAFIDTLGYTREELIGKTSGELGLFDDHGLRIIITEKVSRHIPVKEVEVVSRTKSGGQIIGLFSAELIYVGVEKCLLTMLVDITDRKQAEAKIKQARDEVEKANLAKSEFLSRMSHELRTPMNSILGFAQLLEMGELNQKQKLGVNYILNSGHHLLRLIDDILDISRIEAGRASLFLEPVQVSLIIEEIMDSVEPLATIRQIKLELENSPGNRLFAMCDITRLKQVLINLLSNAVKYNRLGGSIRVKTEMMPRNDAGIVFIRVSVTDDGSGISSDDIPKIFTPFERIGSEKTEIEGTGLGLTVVKKLMDAMNGTVGVESIHGEGSTFWIELPMVENHKSRQEINEENAKRAAELTIIEKKYSIQKEEALKAGMPETEKTGTILYIEDNIPNALLVEEIIEYYRPAIRLINSIYGKHTVALAIKYKPDLILLDIDLPDISGIEVIKLLQAEEITSMIPVVIVSADAMPQQVEKYLNAGAKDYLTKPFDLSYFLQVVDEWMGINN